MDEWAKKREKQRERERERERKRESAMYCKCCNHDGAQEVLIC